LKLVAGLGNVPESRYGGTRHNVGFRVLDELADRRALTFERAPVPAVQAQWRSAHGVVWLLKPLTLMNLSGEAVAAACRFYKIELSELLVVSDDTNLPLGRLRARRSGSEGGHNGLRSVAEHLGTTEYQRFRIGVGRGDVRRDLADHVLSRFDPDEQAAVDAVVSRAADAVETWVAEGLDRMMSLFNAPETSPTVEEDGKGTT
jgi:PTH1 family peptidyl-tRNA hydrolase